jgi:hypothetical protein
MECAIDSNYMEDFKNLWLRSMIRVSYHNNKNKGLPWLPHSNTINWEYVPIT